MRSESPANAIDIMRRACREGNAMYARKRKPGRVNEARLRAAVPPVLIEQLQQIAEGDGSTLSTTVRRLLMRAVAREFAQQRSDSALVQEVR